MGICKIPVTRVTEDGGVAETPSLSDPEDHGGRDVTAPKFAVRYSFAGRAHIARDVNPTRR